MTDDAETNDGDGLLGGARKAVGDAVDAVHPGDRVKLATTATVGGGLAAATGAVGLSLGLGYATGLYLTTAVSVLCERDRRHGDGEGRISEYLSRFDTLRRETNAKSPAATFGRIASVGALAVGGLAATAPFPVGTGVVTAAMVAAAGGDVLRGVADVQYRRRGEEEKWTADEEYLLDAEDLADKEWDDESGREADVGLDAGDQRDETLVGEIESRDAGASGEKRSELDPESEGANEDAAEPDEGESVDREAG